ncbi:cob(I)yrinic acid a,c-diamide adenosyltransferase [Thalassoglobus polymorphus]|uniref:Corrinoid adenosyltransferase n=1 Tax=Thalassoglobus polymorphus TaxID=2527994 RepID=A0A517QLV1_9PLAN|nr:cob(I)yrinic acid a,c-diamide adenosyltransferase [Thalassoglobus polymorphus]QDT32606.1 Cob(I)yrinic acid a,c-diamide adenosyltransferase [Thalassoglobus polymorphus]
MVYLNKIYTKTGDSGETSLGDGTRVPKTHVRIGAYGGVDELNAVIGVAIACGSLPNKTAEVLTSIQNDLFDVGADLCVPESDEPPEYEPLRMTQPKVDQLEKWIDANTEKLTPLNSFILPGGNPGAAHLHLARTVCRRAEIGVIALAEVEKINPLVVIYLNRLSDLLFVLARIVNDHGEADILWKPGGERSGE